MIELHSAKLQSAHRPIIIMYSKCYEVQIILVIHHSPECFVFVPAQGNSK